MEGNYLTAVFAAQAALKIWKEDDKQTLRQEDTNPASKLRVRQVVFVSSTAALVAVPGYDAYTRMLKPLAYFKSRER